MRKLLGLHADNVKCESIVASCVEELERLDEDVHATLVRPAADEQDVGRGSFSGDQVLRVHDIDVGIDPRFQAESPARPVAFPHEIATVLTGREYQIGILNVDSVDLNEHSVVPRRLLANLLQIVFIRSVAVMDDRNR